MRCLKRFQNSRPRFIELSPSTACYEPARAERLTCRPQRDPWFAKIFPKPWRCTAKKQDSATKHFLPLAWSTLLFLRYKIGTNRGRWYTLITFPLTLSFSTYTTCMLVFIGSEFVSMFILLDISTFDPIMRVCVSVSVCVCVCVCVCVYVCVCVWVCTGHDI